MNKKEYAGCISVDAGIVMVGDPCYHIGKDKPPEDFCRSWQEFCTEKLQDKDIIQLNHGNGAEGLAVVIGGFGGDGCYPVYIEKDKHGLVKRMLVEFQE